MGLVSKLAQGQSDIPLPGATLWFGRSQSRPKQTVTLSHASLLFSSDNAIYRLQHWMPWSLTHWCKLWLLKIAVMHLFYFLDAATGSERFNWVGKQTQPVPKAASPLTQSCFSFAPSGAVHHWATVQVVTYYCCFLLLSLQCLWVVAITTGTWQPAHARFALWAYWPCLVGLLCLINVWDSVWTKGVCVSSPSLQPDIRDRSD